MFNSSIPNLKAYTTYRLDNGLRIIHLSQHSPIAYCGVIVNVGSRDEGEGEQGMAHFVEHMLFKGTEKRHSRQIINRLEDVGGELNAYTTKEQTVVYAGFLTEYTERAVELIADLVQHSAFPEQELDKEIGVVCDEIQSYNDSPADLIYDDFEEMLFQGTSMAHNVLGQPEHIKGFSSSNAQRFYSRFYTPENTVFFSVGSIDAKKIVKWCDKYFHFTSNGFMPMTRVMPPLPVAARKTLMRDTFQTHCLIGGRAYNVHHPERMTLYLLNNILGGPGMNSRLNMSLREQNGLVYHVESSVQLFTDCGWWGVYFGTDPENAAKCEHLVRKELKKLCDTKISEFKLNKYKLQLMGQLAIAAENKENLALALGKSYMYLGKYDSNEEVREEIAAITSEQLRNTALELFDVDRLSVLKYNRI